VLVLRARPGGGGGSAPLAVLRTPDFHALAFSPADPDLAFFGHHNGVLRSDDGGRTWKPLVEQRNFDAMGLAVSRADPRRAFLAGHDVFQASADGGATWQPIQHNLPGTDLHAFAISPDDANRLYAFAVGHGVFRSGDGARTWERLGQVPGDVTALAAAGGAGDAEVLFLGSASAGVLRSADGGRTWAPAVNGLESRRVLSLAVDPVARQTAYAGTEGGVHKTTDGGLTWSKLPYPGKNAAALAVSPARPARLLAISVTHGAGEVYRSDDGGRSWGRG
jgi:photosystem II stability/assembly factor-like uncharacterized protein